MAVVVPCTGRTVETFVWKITSGDSQFELLPRPLALFLPVLYCVGDDMHIHSISSCRVFVFPSLRVPWSFVTMHVPFHLVDTTSFSISSMEFDFYVTKKISWDKRRRGATKQDTTSNEKTRLDMTKQDKTRQVKTRQDKTRLQNTCTFTADKIRKEKSK
jgi:hypothetical protein